MCSTTSTREEQPPIALSPSVLSDLWDAFRAGEGVDLVRDAVRMVMPELIETEAAQQIGAFRTRRLDHVEFPYVCLDATDLQVRNQASQMTSMTVVIATAITAVGEREALGVGVGDSVVGFLVMRASPSG